MQGGNHGGSTEAETSAVRPRSSTTSSRSISLTSSPQALLLAAPTLRLDERTLRVPHSSPYKHFEIVQQIDLVPTLSVLFDLGVPRCAALPLLPLLPDG